MASSTRAAAVVVLAMMAGAALAGCNAPPPRGRAANAPATLPPPPQPAASAGDAICDADGGAQLEGCADTMPRCLEVWEGAAADDGPEPDCSALLAD